MRDTTKLHDQIIEILRRHITPVIAEGVFVRALRDCRLEPELVDGSNIDRLYTKLESNLGLVSSQRNAALWSELDAIADTHRSQAPLTVVLRGAHERDIEEARAYARLFCERLRARSVPTVRVITIISELARNIVRYTPGGQIELLSERTPKLKGILRATDTGPGISNLDEIFAGKYKSRTGLGKGILGVRRLSDRFEIDTSPGGTRIEVDVLL